MDEGVNPEVTSQVDPPEDRDEAAPAEVVGQEIPAELPDADAGAVAPCDVAVDAPEGTPGSDPSTRSGPPAGSQESLLAAVRGLEASLSRQLSELKGSIDRERRAEAAREKVVDRLHAELQEYKQDLLLSLLRPVFLDLIQLHDDVGKILDAPARHDSTCEEIGAAQGVEASRPEGESDRLRKALDGVRRGIEDVLYRQGVEPYTTEGVAFDARRQRAVSTVPAEDPRQARAVAARVRCGFRSGERIIRPEIVTVYAAHRESGEETSSA
jgi:molecular chaperone GrpE